MFLHGWETHLFSPAAMTLSWWRDRMLPSLAGNVAVAALLAALVTWIVMLFLGYRRKQGEPAIDPESEQAIDTILKEIDREAQQFRDRAKGQERLNRYATAILAILAIAAPSLVTFVLAKGGNDRNGRFVLFVVFVTAVGGAGNTLLGIFRWGERYRRSQLTGMELDQLSRSAKGRLWRIGLSPPVKEKDLEELAEEVGTRYQEIIRNHIESETSLLPPPLPETPALVRPPRPRRPRVSKA
jgi:hypothetical protein